MMNDERQKEAIEKSADGVLQEGKIRVKISIAKKFFFLREKT